MEIKPMSYKYGLIVGIRKMVWDEMWHVLYKWGNRTTWDRVSKKVALKVEREMKGERNGNL